MNIFVITVLITVLSTIADWVLKNSADTGNRLLLVLGITLYIMDAMLWFWAYKFGEFSTVGILYSILTILLTVGIGIFCFHEIIGIREIIGIGFGVTSIILLGKFL